MHGHDLVELGFGACIDGDGGLGRNAIGAAAHVGHDDLVAQPVHLEKRHAAQWSASQSDESEQCSWKRNNPFRLYMADAREKCQ
ncbi:hypothetical protein D3C72_1953450 [compost metagenome]